MVPFSASSNPEVQQVAVPESSTNAAPAPSMLSRTSHSSATVAARKLAAEAQHARRLAELAAEEAEVQVKRLQLEKQAAEIELQAEMAAIEAEAGSSQSRVTD